MILRVCSSVLFFALQFRFFLQTGDVPWLSCSSFQFRMPLPCQYCAVCLLTIRVLCTGVANSDELQRGCAYRLYCCQPTWSCVSVEIWNLRSRFWGTYSCRVQDRSESSCDAICDEEQFRNGACSDCLDPTVPCHEVSVRSIIKWLDAAQSCSRGTSQFHLQGEVRPKLLHLCQAAVLFCVIMALLI